jgi:hypothetical protein
MAYLVQDTPYTYVLVRDEFLYNDESGHGDFTEGCIIGVVALDGRAPLFTVMLRNGAIWARLPLHALVTQPCEPRPLTELVYWDSLSYHVAVHKYAFLTSLRVDVWPRGHAPFGERGSYLFTLDWAEGDYPEMPDQHKQHHIIALDSGHICAMPGNRLRWHEPSWIKPFVDIPAYRVQTQEFVSEREIPIKDGAMMSYESAPEAKD